MRPRSLVLAVMGVAALCGAVALVALAGSPPRPPAPTPIASLSELREHEVLFVEDHDLYLVDADGVVLAFSNDAQHLGDVVQFCSTSRLFESAAHGEKFDIHGNYVAGPARSGLTRYEVHLDGDGIFVDFDRTIEGTPKGARALEPAGPFCVRG